MSKRSARAPSGYLDTEKQMKARGWRPIAFIVLSYTQQFDPLMLLLNLL